MTTTVGDPAELLVVLVQERARVALLEAPDRQPGRAIEIDEARHAGPPQDCPNGRRRVTEQRPQSVGPPAPPAAGIEHALDLGCRRHPRRAMRSRRAIDEAGIAFGPVPAHPLVAGRPTDAHRFGRGHDRPALVEHPRHQQMASEDVETGSRMSHESLPTVRILNNPNRARRLSLVNNVFGDDT
jgi:hypothetical protein